MCLPLTSLSHEERVAESFLLHSSWPWSFSGLQPLPRLCQADTCSLGNHRPCVPPIHQHRWLTAQEERLCLTRGRETARAEDEAARAGWSYRARRSLQVP